MRIPWTRNRAVVSPAAESLSEKHRSCRGVITRNNEVLELLAGVQEDLMFAPPRDDVVGARVVQIFCEVEKTVAALEQLTGRRQAALRDAIGRQHREVVQFLGARQERSPGRLAARLSDIGAEEAAEAGAKAAVLADIRNRLAIPVPDGYVLTVEAYERFWTLPNWQRVRDATRNLEATDLTALRHVARELKAAVATALLPRAVEVALLERAATLDSGGLGLSVRSSAVGEGAARSFAGQFRSFINVASQDLVGAYKGVVASRFSERAMAYRLALGLPDIGSPMAVLVLQTIPARAAGMLYTRNPQDPRRDELWIAGRWGLGLDLAQGRHADLFVVSRRRGYAGLEQRIVRKDEEILPRPGGGLWRRRVGRQRAEAPTLGPDQLRTLAEWGLRIEHHFGGPQDLEWALDEDGKLWIVQARPLALAGGVGARTVPKGEVVLSGGRTVFPGCVSGPAFLADTPRQLQGTPEGAILFLRRASPDIVRLFPRISGLVAEWGSITGHAATLLREFQIPSLFETTGAFERIETGQVVSLDSGAGRVYAGTAWPAARRRAAAVVDPQRRNDVVSTRMLALNLVDPSAWRFRASRCQSAHDVLRFCHEKAIEEMFALNDRELKRGAQRDKRLLTDAGLNIHVLDLGGGLHPDVPDADGVTPGQVTSRPFQAIWRGLTHPDVTWNRDMPAGLGGLASVMGQALSASQPSAARAVGAKSYLMVSPDYMNLNARLAFHFTLVDASVSNVPGENAITFRFAGGGATLWRRDLRACFIEACLSHYGFEVDRRGDLINAWFKKASASDTEERLDIVGRLMACSSQLDMYMTGEGVMRWYVQQFLAGNYGFRA